MPSQTTLAQCNGVDGLSWRPAGEWSEPCAPVADAISKISACAALRRGRLARRARDRLQYLDEQPACADGAVNQLCSATLKTSRLSGRAWPIRSQIVRVVAIEQILPYQAARERLDRGWDPASIANRHGFGARPGDATGGIARMLAVQDGIRVPDASSKEPNYQKRVQHD